MSRRAPLTMQTEQLWARLWRAVTSALFLAVCLSGCTSPAIRVDSAQERLDTATPPLDGTYLARQTFICSRPNLWELELLPAVYETPGLGTLTLSLCDPGAEGEIIAQQSVDVAEVLHNEPLRFQFPPQRDSAGKAYELLVEGSPGVRVGLWYSSVNAYGEGTLSLRGPGASGDLWFIARCQYGPSNLISDIGRLLLGLGEHQPASSAVLLSLVLLLFVPGYLLRGSLAPTQTADPIGNLALSLAFSLASVPVVLLWTTTVGLRWNRTLCVATYAVLSLCTLARLLKTGKRRLAAWARGISHWPLVWGLTLFGLTTLLRFIQIQDLVLPAWVDSPQHVLVTELVARQGQVPHSYEPLLPVPYFVYHFGFHSIMAVFHWLSGLPIPQGMLILGQVLNAACGLTAYLWTVRLTRRRLAGVVAVLIIGLVSYMPAYYVSWGRYTQLTGMLLMPAALVMAMNWMETPRRNLRLLLVAGLLLAGLFLTHIRVTAFGLAFLTAYLITETLAAARHSGPRRRLELWARMGAMWFVALILVAPWLAQLLSGVSEALRTTGATLQGDPAYNVFPGDLLWVPHNRELLLLAGVGALWGLLHHRRETVWVLGGCGLVALITNPGLVGLPNTNVLNNATAVITLFLPLAMLSSQAIVALWDGIPRLVPQLRVRPRLQRALRAGLLVLLATAGLWGMWSSVDMVNPVTVLATVEDMAAMGWIRDNTPEDAIFLINARLWQQSAYTGTDGGYWIPRLTGRRTTLPEIPYIYGDPEYVKHVTGIAQAVSTVRTQEDARLVEISQQEQVSHIYIGAKGGPLSPQMFVGNAHYRAVYDTGAVWIFEVVR